MKSSKFGHEVGAQNYFDLIFATSMKTCKFWTLVLVLILVNAITQFSACNARESPTVNKHSAHLAHKLRGTVIKISDGDTFHMLLDDKSTVKVRLHGIDCPEKRQPFYQQAKNGLSTLIFQKKITIEWKNKDRYVRLLAIAYVDDECVNEKMLRNGLAWHFKRYDNNPNWDALEKKARLEKVGIWSEPGPTAPWLFRQNR